MSRVRARVGAAVFVAAGAAAAAWGQPFSATLTFEASTDGGTTWRAGEVVLEPVAQSLLIRLRADWTPEAGYALAGLAFDGVVRNAAPGDEATGFVRPPPFDRVPTQTVAAMRFGSTIKIDDSRDTLPPDQGARWVRIEQAPQNFNPDFDASRPLTAFLWEYIADGTEGTREADVLVARHPDPGTMERVIRVYTSPAGEQQLIVVGRVDTLSIQVVPSPGAAVLAMGVVFLAGRRRRG